MQPVVNASFFLSKSCIYIYDIHTFRQSVTITIVEAVRGSLWLSMLTSHMPGIPTLATMTANLPGHYDPASWKGWTRWLWICNDMYGWLWTYVKGSLKATDNIFFVQLPHCALDLWKGSRVYPTLWRRWSLPYALLRAHCNADGQ